MLGGDNRAVVGSDHYSAYGHLPLRRRQVCWAHLGRTFQVYVSGLRWRFHNYLGNGHQFDDARTVATCANLLDLGPALRTFVRRDPERALRALLTVRDTLRQQQRNFLTSVVSRCCLKIFP